MTIVKSILTVVAVCGMLLLTGCSTNIGYSVLDRGSSPEDALPAVVLEQSEGVDSSTSRFIGVHDGVSFWLARSSGREGICLIGFPSDQEWVVSCGGAGSNLAFRGTSGIYELYPDGVPAPDGPKRIFENIFLVSN